MSSPVWVDMATRGLIGVKMKGGWVRFVYNHWDSYPSHLMLWINDRLLQGDHEKFKEEILAGHFTREYEIHFTSRFKGPNYLTKVDYLFHEYVYVLDFDKKVWSAYKAVWDEDEKKPVEQWDNSKGHLEPLALDIPFDAIVIIQHTRDEPRERIMVIEELRGQRDFRSYAKAKIQPENKPCELWLAGTAIKKLIVDITTDKLTSVS